MRRLLSLILLLPLLTLSACEQDSSGSAADSAVEPDRGIVTDMGGMETDASEDVDSAVAADTGADATATDAGIEADAMSDPDAAPMRDMMMPVEIDSCESACARYDTCGRTGDVFGSSEQCLANCERLTRGGEDGVQGWWNCASTETCNLLHLCPVPQVEALECDEICGLVDNCEIGLNFPDCQASCAAGGEAFQTCAEEIYGVCNNDSFVQCLGREVYQNCDRFCEPAIACNVVRAGECQQSCIQSYLNADPLADANQDRITQCVLAANGNCGDIDECIQPFSFEPPALVSEAAFCAAFNQCELGFFDGDCADEYNNLLISGGASAIRCAVDAMQAQCPDFFFELEQVCQNAARTLVTTACSRFCGAQQLCEVLEGDVPACNSACNESFGDDPDANERVLSSIGCIRENTCPEFTVCLDNASPEGQCERFCAARAACGEIEDDCIAQCDQNWPRDRHANWRQCVADAGENCDAVNACGLTPSIPCPEACARLDECGVASPRCEAACDDLHVREPVAASLQIGCILAADVCEPEPDVLSVIDCLNDPEAAGRACLNFCRSATECDPAADISACLTRCVSGFGDVDGLRFAQAEECLNNAASDAACEIIDACIPAEPAIDCAAYCDQLDACQIDRADCVASCEAAPDVNLIGCVSDAIRAGQQCGGVAACEGIEPPNPSEACTSYCTTQKNCDRTFDTYLCHLGCTPDPDFLNIRNACMSAAGCELAPCLELDASVSPDCENACLTAVACGAFDDEAACAETCTGLIASPSSPVDLMDRINECLAGVRTPAGCDAGEAAQCFQPAFCEAVPDVIFAPRDGGRIDYDTNGLPSAGRMSCGGGGGQQVIVVTIGERSNASFEIVDHNYDPLIELRGECDNAESVIQCNDDSNGLASRIPRNNGTIVLEPGIYYLYIDGFGGRMGTGTVEIQIQPAN